MNHELLFKRILELLSAMLSNGGDPGTITKYAKILCEKYGFSEVNVLLGNFDFQASAMTPDGRPIYAIVPFELGESNFTKVSKLFNYCIEVSRELPDADEIKRRTDEIVNQRYQRKIEKYIAAILGGVGFSVMFACTYVDCMIACLASVLIVLIGSFIEKFTPNTFIYNAVVSLVAEYVILISYHFGWCQHPDRITIGVVMLLISGLGITNGIWYVVSRNVGVGVQKINDSVVGALGIALGIGAPMLTIRMGEIEAFMLHPNFVIQTLACTIACVGFGMWFVSEKKLLPYIAIGALLTWLTYSLVYYFRPILFTATLAAAVVEGFYALLISYKIKCSPIIILTVAIFPLIPGPNLFYMLYGIVTQNYAMAGSEGVALIVTCVAIAFGNSMMYLLERMIVTRRKKKGKNKFDIDIEF